MFVLKKRQPQIIKENIQDNNYKKNSETISYSNYEDILKADRENIENNILLPVKNNIRNTIDKLKILKTKESNNLIKNIFTTINSYLKDIDKNINTINLAEARSEIIDIGLKVIPLKFEFTKGLQLNIIPNTDNYEMFFDIIRRYVFLYKGEKWPPDINDYEYFMYNSDSKELCCYYWPLYAYVKTLFHDDFRGTVDMLDLFSLKKMQNYCTDFFQKKKDKSSLQIISSGKNKKGKQRGGGGENKEKTKELNKKQTNTQKIDTFKQSNNSNKMVSRNSLLCNQNKLNKVKNALKKTIISSNIDGLNIDKETEYEALNRIVRKYIRGLEENDLLVNANSIEEFIKSNTKDSINELDEVSSNLYNIISKKIDNKMKETFYEKCIHIRIDKNTNCLFDPG